MVTNAKAFALLLCLVFSGGLSGGSEIAPIQISSPGDPIAPLVIASGGNIFDNAGGAGTQASRMQRLSRARYAAARHREIVADAGRLLLLAQQLNSEFAGAETYAPSSDSEKKAKEIEKLARKMKEGMEYE